MKNKIYEHILKARNGHYCHVLELTDVYNLEYVIESLIVEYGVQFTLAEYLEFFNSIEIYFIADDDSSDEYNEAIENDLYNADISEIVKEAYNGL